MRVSIFKKEFLIKNGICKVENNILLYMAYPMNIINSEHSISLLAQTLLGRNTYAL